MHDLDIRRIARGPGAQLQQAGDVLGDDDLRSTGADVLELAAQDGLAPLRLAREVCARAAAAHRALVQLHDLEVRDPIEQASHRAPFGTVDRQCAGLVDGHAPAQRAEVGAHPVAVKKVTCQSGVMGDLTCSGAHLAVIPGDARVLAIVLGAGRRVPDVRIDGDVAQGCAVPDRHVHHGVPVAERASRQTAAAEPGDVDVVAGGEQHPNGRVGGLGRGEIREAADQHRDRSSHRLGRRRKLPEHLIDGAVGWRAALLGKRTDGTQPRQQSSATRQAIQPGASREARETVERAQRAGSRENAAQCEGLRPGVALLGVQLLTSTADDVSGRNAGRAGGDAVVAGQAARERPVGDVAQLEATLHCVADQRDASAGRLPFHGIDDICRACGLTERALVALARRLVDVGKKAGGRDGGAGHWARIVDEIANRSTEDGSARRSVELRR